MQSKNLSAKKKENQLQHWHPEIILTLGKNHSRHLSQDMGGGRYRQVEIIL